MGIIKFSTLVYKNITCRSYFNDDLDNGIEVYLDDVRIGSMLHINIVYSDDGDEFTEFVNEVENWISENELNKYI